MAGGVVNELRCYPSPAGGGWTRAKRAAGWGIIEVDPTRLRASRGATLPLAGEGSGEAVLLQQVAHGLDQVVLIDGVLS